MKTALQQLIEYLDPIHQGIKDKAIQLLEVEKEQIIDAYSLGYGIGYDDAKFNTDESNEAEQYYNETYK